MLEEPDKKLIGAFMVAVSALLFAVNFTMGLWMISVTSRISECRSELRQIRIAVQQYTGEPD